MRDTNATGWTIAAVVLLAIGCGGGDNETGQSGASGGMTSSGGKRSTGGMESGGTEVTTDVDAGVKDEGMFGPYLASCDYRASSGTLADRCRDWYGGPNPPNLSASCSDNYMHDPCPSDGRVGQCQLDPVLSVVAVYNYYEPTWTAESAMDDCVGGYRSDNKTWIPTHSTGDAGVGDAGIRDAGVSEAAQDAGR